MAGFVRDVGAAWGTDIDTKAAFWLTAAARAHRERSGLRSLSSRSTDALLGENAADVLNCLAANDACSAGRRPGEQRVAGPERALETGVQVGRVMTSRDFLECLPAPGIAASDR